MWALQTLADYTDGPSEILTGLNGRLSGRAGGMATCLAMQFSADCHSVRIANAGHLSPYMDRHEIPTEDNIPLSLLIGAVYGEITYPLHPGQRLVVLTDGVPENMHGREFFGFDITRALCSEVATDIASAACVFGQTDDITVLSIDVPQSVG